MEFAPSICDDCGGARRADGTGSFANLGNKQQIATLKDRVELADQRLGDTKEKIVKAGEEKAPLHTTVKELNAQIDKLKKRKAQLPRELQSIVDRLAASSATASKQVSKLSEAQAKHTDKPDQLSDFAKKP